MLDFLKTMPDMTTQEITMIETPKPSISQRIRDYKATNPNASMKEVASAVGTSLPYVYQVLAPTPKKEKKEKKDKVAAPKAEKPISKKDFDNLSEDNEVKKMIIAAQANRIQELNVIIEYLESKIDELNEIKYA
jgi:hypothetical protein